MAVLNAGPGGRGVAGLRRAHLVIGALLASTVAGCIVFEKLGLIDPPLRFSHARHADEGLSCDDCHAPSSEGGAPSMPAAGQCALCHDGIDAEKPESRRAAALFVDGKARDAGVGRLSSEVIFSHGEHTDIGLECASCHRGIEASTAVDSSLMVNMADCQRCHAGAGVAAGCETCHTEIRKDVPPPNHRHAWKQLHGSVVRGGMDGASNDCAMCHSEATCNTCHADEAPANHNNTWRLRTHGIEAGMDRQSCATCHRSDFCSTCHEETTPQSHKGGWGTPLDTHCLTCHFPLKLDSCVVCHKSTPSHQEATPLPSDHLPGMNCRQCHGVTAPLPHADKGDSCTACHQ